MYCFKTYENTVSWNFYNCTVCFRNYYVWEWFRVDCSSHVFNSFLLHYVQAEQQFLKECTVVSKN